VLPGRLRLSVAGLALTIAILVAGCGAASPPGTASGSSGAPASASSTESSVPPSPTASSTLGADASPSSAALPAGRLVFDRFAGNPEGPWLGTFIADSDGGAIHPLMLPVKADGGLTAVWSPTGARLLVNVWSPPSGPSRPGVVNPDGSAFHLLQPKGLTDDLGCSSWSPDGLTLLCAVSSANPNTNGIYRLRTDGTGLTQLTKSPYHDTVGTAGECGGGDSRAVYSPDGKQFAFIRQKCGVGPDPSSDESGVIIIANADGSALREVVVQGGVRTHPGSQLSWSPDGRDIAFGTQDLYLSLVHPDGTGLTRINVDFGSAGVGGAFGPAWSPDGTRIVFSTYANGQQGDRSVAPDGSAPSRVTGTTAGGAFVHWAGPAAP
jgi:Tol biopolymer transport system component